MLDAVLAGFLNSVSEREFDVPLVALLRSHGFFDVHLVHGQFEFGKDVIAKKTVEGETSQYAFQSKAGDIGLPQWHAMYGQVETLRLNTLSHPSFDASLPRIPVLVATGRLIGGAPVAIQEYQAALSGQSPPAINVWPHDTLLELLRAAPEVGLVADGTLLGLLSQIEAHELTDSDLERFSRRWITPGSLMTWSTVLEASLVSTNLRDEGHLDLACITALLLLRAVWASMPADDPADSAIEQADLAGTLFSRFAKEVWEGCTNDVLDPTHLTRDDDGMFVTYPIRCCRIAELIGLYGLREADQREEIADWLARFLESQPGTWHPASDRWALSLVPALTLIRSGNPTIASHVLRETCRWLGDHYDDVHGLGGVIASPSEEVDYLLGDGLEHITLPRRTTTFLGAVLMDMAACLELADVYDDVRNDVLALELAPIVPTPLDDAGQYGVENPGIVIDTSPNYADDWNGGEGWRMAPHHDDDLDRLLLGRLGRTWDWTAIGVALRDRHWVAAIRDLAGMRGTVA